MIDPVTIAKIKDAANIVDVVSDFVTLKRAGANLKGLCPFHDDRTPSFMVSPAKNYCKCFACGKGGNPIGFIMEHEQISYPEALRYLAKKYGITIQEKELTEEDKQHNDDRESMFIVNEWANKWFQHELNETPEGRSIGLSYFRERGFRDDIIKKFQLGFCPDSRDGRMSQDALKAGFQEKYLVNDPETGLGTGLSIKREGSKQLRDRFWGRVMFPIFTMSGKVVGFGGRVLDAATKGVNVKYQNSPESFIYSKRRELYGLFHAKQAIRKEDLCILVEGYTDVMAMHQSGIENVVSSSGTALTEEQIRTIHRLTDNITVIYDGDAAGIKASQRGIDMLLAQGMNVRLLLLPDGDDPDSFARKHNAEEFQQYLRDHQVDFIKFKTDLLMQEAQGDPIAKSKLVNNIVQSIACIPNEVTRAVYIQTAAQMMQLDERIVTHGVSEEAKKMREEKMRERERERMRQNLTAGNAPTNEGVPLPTDIPLPTDKPNTDENIPPTMSHEAEGTIATDTATNLANTIMKRDQERLLKKERELMWLIVRKGENIIEAQAENATTPSQTTVAAYIDASLRNEGISLIAPLHQRMLDIVLEDKGTQNAERLLINHDDPAVSRLAFELAYDNEELSKIFQSNTPAPSKTLDVTQQERQEEQALAALVSHILSDYLLELVQQQEKELMRQLAAPELKNNPQQMLQVMQQLKDLQARRKRLKGEG